MLAADNWQRICERASPSDPYVSVASSSDRCDLRPIGRQIDSLYFWIRLFAHLESPLH